MLEPQSTMTFALLIVMFGALVWRIMVGRLVALRVTASCLAFVTAMVFGVLAVNRYYDYYQTWGAMVADLTHQGVGAASGVPEVKLESGVKSGTLDGSRGYLELAQQQGYLMRLTVTGQHSRITRAVYVYLPPQYFQPAHQAYRFPVIELIHGQPGEPQDWISVAGVTQTFGRILERKLARPAVLVMPDANGARAISLQCLNQAGGAQDLTYLAVDLPSQIARTLRVLPPGAGWGVAGYSEGGFCAANMALRYPGRYGFAGVLSGYFAPEDNRLAGGRLVSPFGGNAMLRDQNTPLDEVRALPAAAVIPRFWLAAGTADGQAVADTKHFLQDLRPRQPDAALTLTPGGGHSMTTWRAEIPSMLTWMTQGLARAAAPSGVTFRALWRPRGGGMCCDPGMDFDAYERVLWAGRAAAYERGFARLTAHTAGALLDAAGVAADTRLLDVGTGPGVVARAAVARGARVTAIDAEPSMAEAAARNVPGLDVRVAVLPDLPLPDGAFGAVTGNFVINAMGDPAAALAELRRVLRAGGRLALTCWSYPPPPALGVAAEAIEAAGVPWPDDVPLPPFRAYSAPEAFAALLAEAGLTGATARLLSWEHRVDPEQWWKEVYLSRVGSNGMVIGRQDTATVARIKNEFDRLIARYAVDASQVALPVVAVLASGIR